MREFKPLSWLMVLFVGTAFAADGVVPSRVLPSANTTAVAESGVRTTSARTTTANASRTTTKSATPQNVVSRGTMSASRNSTDTSVRKQVSISDSPAARRAGVVLRPSVAEFGGRATIYGTNQQTGSNIDNDIRKVTGRAASTTVNKQSIAEAKETLEQTADLNKSCQEQYNECMDQFCAVIDANQKRCSCSSNLSKYSKVEDAVNEANTKLNEVAQNIRYIGLSADEIRAIMTATEAEEALSGTRDNTENRNLLEQIEKMIKDPTSSASYYSSSDFGLDMDLDFSTTTDIFSLDFLNTNTSSFSNLRGTELYNAAKNRCNTVLNQCKKAGATIKQVTGNYDLAIDKDCIAYENGLKKMNETLVSNVRSAERMLQKARLAVLQNKNQYDAKGCIGALETCMTDDMVCGSDYSKCLDPTKKYIDENGNVVLGQDINKITKFMSGYDNSSVDSAYLSDAYSKSISDSSCGTDGKCVVKYLLQKIGTKQKVTDEGLCRAVLDKCQAYTYTDGTYKPYNDVVVNYVQRAMVNIRAAQRKIISDYASNCMVDVAACYNQQVTQVNAWSSYASINNIYQVMNGACHNVALTCAYSILVNETEEGSTNPLCSNGNEAACIEGLSEMFYQSLLCPDNSTYNITGGSIDNNGTAAGWVNAKCKCNAGYDVWSGYCVAACDDGSVRNTSGTCVKCDTNATVDTTTKKCVCNTGYTGDGYTCTANTTTEEQEE